MNTPLKRFHSISKYNYSDLGQVDILDESTLDIMKIVCTPYEGIHKDISYTLTIKFQEDEQWPFIYIDSEIFDKIKTNNCKGICIKKLSYGYSFRKNFRELCDNKWENYIYYLLSMFNNIQDFEKGNGIKSKYKEIL